MTPLTIASFWVHRPLDYPSKEYPVIAPYLKMLAILDRSCKRVGYNHIVLTDHETAERVNKAGLNAFSTALPRNLMKATTEVQARWLESIASKDVDTCFVGADCLVRRDFQSEVPACDLAIAYMKGHKKWRMQNGFMYVRAESGSRVAPLFREIANDTGDAMCDDMLAIERALAPMPPDYGRFERRGLQVNFLPLPTWNRYMAVDKRNPNPLADAAEDAAVLHFMGGWHNGKQLYFDWAKAYGFA